jgi:hypothetical protein
VELTLRAYFAAHANEADIQAVLVEYNGSITRQQARAYHGRRMADLSERLDAEAARAKRVTP